MIKKSNKNIKNLLYKTRTVLLCYFDVFTPHERLNLQKKLKEKDLNLIIIKTSKIKSLLLNSKYKKIFNLLQGNVILIYSNKILNQLMLKEILNDKKLKLIGGKWENKLVRPSSLIKYMSLNKNKTVILPLQLTVSALNTIKTLALINFNKN